MMNNTTSDNEHSIRLTATEVASLWTSYQNDTMAICVIKYMLAKVEDNEIRPVFEFAMDLATTHIQLITEVFKEEGFPIPYGFTDEDVDLSAPRLFSDGFWLSYLHIMTVHGLTGYAVALTTATRSDIRDFYTQCNHSSTELYNKSIDILLSKGIFTRPPYISTPVEAEFVQKQSFLNGWFGDRRPLNAVEISNIFFNLKKDMVCKALKMGFSQVTKSKEVTNYIVRGLDIYDKHIEVFSSILHENDLPSPMRFDSEVTNSKVSPFSDKLIMFHEMVLISASVAFYGAGMAVCMRRDLALQYQRILTETQKLAEDGAELLINHGLMEQVPQADDRRKLAQL